MVFDRAPASYRIHGAFRFSGVRETIPTFIPTNRLLTSRSPRLPFSMSVADIHGFAAWMTSGSQSRIASATHLLRSPDHLRTTLYSSLISPAPNAPILV